MLIFTDVQVIAYHAEAVEELWPFDLSLDAECWWASQWLQSVLAAIKYRSHVLVDARTIIANRVHRAYPKGACVPAFDAATRKLRALLPPAAAACARFVNATPHGLPPGWQRPLRTLVKRH